MLDVDANFFSQFNFALFCTRCSVKLFYRDLMSKGSADLCLL